MITHLSTYHDLRAIGIIRAFVAETGRFFGANNTEVQQLELAAEEAAAFIITALQPDKDEQFEIDAQSIANGLRFLFRNKGMPVDEDNLPVYDSRNPEDSVAGLPFFLLESLTDTICFRNEGNAGWVLIFEKRFINFIPLQAPSPVDAAVIVAHAKEKLAVTIAEPADAYEIVKLTYLTYRYSYIKSVFYYRKELEEAISSERVIAFVAKNAKGEVVINSAYFRSPHCDVIAEAGMLMARPEYRKNRALLRVSKMQKQYLKDAVGLQVSYAQLVTAHTKSQRLTLAFQFIPTALKLSLHDQVEFVGIETNKTHRESLLYAILAPNGLDHVTIFLPEPYLTITEMLCERLENITFSTKSAAPDVETTGFTIEHHEKERYAIVTIESMGRDWLQKLRRHLKELSDDGIITINLHIPTDRPLPDDFEENTRKLRLFYSGIVIKTMQRWEVVYTLLQGQHFDFDAVALSDEKAIALREYMRAQYDTLVEQL